MDLNDRENDLGRWERPFCQFVDVLTIDDGRQKGLPRRRNWGGLRSRKRAAREEERVDGIAASR
jgi:hypothetical protein